MDMEPLLALGLLVCSGLLFAHASGAFNSSYTGNECQPDLDEPETAEEYDARAAVSRARTRYLESEIERQMKEAEHSDVLNLIKDMRRRNSAQGH